MRSVFTVNIPSNESGEYPSNTEILHRIRSFGWEPIEIQRMNEDEAAKEVRYKELADKLFNEMPEIAKEEKESVIFFGYLADDQTKFVITRSVEGQITFRLLHPVLPRLQSSTTKMVKKLISCTINKRQLEISNQTVVIYERGFDHIIISGRVIPNPVREALRTDRKNVLLATGPLILAVPVMFGLLVVNSDNSPLLGGTMERFSTALLTTSLVSALSLFQTYYEIRRERLISWAFTSDPRVQ